MMNQRLSRQMRRYLFTECDKGAVDDGVGVFCSSCCIYRLLLCTNFLRLTLRLSSFPFNNVADFANRSNDTSLPTKIVIAVVVEVGVKAAMRCVRIVPRDLGTAGFKELVADSYFRTRPFNRVNLFTEEAKETEFMGRSLIIRYNGRRLGLRIWSLRHEHSV